VSFVIPVLNGERFVGPCLEHVRLESRPGDEVLIVDNGSTDRTVEIVRSVPGISLLEAPGLTIAALRNRGAALATNGILAFIDADCHLCPGWRESVERVLADPAVSATGSYYDIPESATWVERAWWSFRPRHEHRTSFLISGNLVIRRAAFESVRGFDERLITDEDSDISRRLVSAGAVLVEAPSVRVVHLGNARTLREFFGKERWHATSIMATMRAHSVDRPMLLTWVFMITCAVAVAVMPLGITGWRGATAMVLLIAVAPGLTAAHKVVTRGNYKYFFHLLPLYLIVYVVRTLVLLEVLLRPRPSR
jgi:glycosyltransferase involved in cell wall biosynthesis